MSLHSRPIRLLREFEVVRNSHPIELISIIRNNYGAGLELEFSRYVYRPQSILDVREIFRVPINRVDVAWLQTEFARLPPGWELALNSRVYNSKGRKSHIPMIDYVGRQLPSDYSHFPGLLGSLASRMMFVDSGRSYHSYAPVLISHSKWIGFMGRLLLLNLPNSPPLTDSRWVGHRLVGGFSALRWSNNSEQYLKLPEIVSIGEIGRLKRELSKG